MALTFIGLSPLCGSHEPPSLRDLIEWDCDWTEVSLSSLPVIAVAAVPCGVRSDQLARLREQTTERTYPVCWYSIVKEQEGYFSTHPLVSSLKGKNTTIFKKNFLIFLFFIRLTKKSPLILVKNHKGQRWLFWGYAIILLSLWTSKYKNKGGSFWRKIMLTITHAAFQIFLAR